MEDVSKGKVPTVFLSSTCYDLRQIRADLKRFFEEALGFDILLSEFSSFPVNPDTNTIDNCTEAVKEYADILVLVVGGRYGCVTDSGKSITNLEYITAKEKGIPIYVFIDRNVMNMINLWKDNPTMDFSSAVDSIKVFEFIDSLRNKENIWVYGFEYAQDIISILRIQVAHLFYIMLRLKKQVDSTRLTVSLEKLKGESLRLLLEKPIAWEYKIFGQVYEDGLKNLKNLKRDYKYGISIEKSKRLSDFQEIIDWILEKINDFGIIAENLGLLINEKLQEALGKPGEPADIEYVVYVGEKMVELYKKTIQIGLEVKFLAVDDEFKELVKFPIQVCDSIIEDIENYCQIYQDGMNSIIEDKKMTLELKLNMRSPNFDKFYSELDSIRNLYGLK